MEAPRFTKVKNCVFGGAEPERQVSQVKLGKLVELFVNHAFSYGSFTFASQSTPSGLPLPRLV
jgi:hypothetical protein